jgi:hypothetical protein
MTDALSGKIIDEIKQRGIEPRPRWKFLVLRFVLWLSAIFSTILGGITFAVIVFATVDYSAHVRTYLMDNVIGNFISATPFFWLISLVILVVVTRYGVRQTKFGYRYPTARIVGAVIMSSILLGTILTVANIGQKLQEYLDENLPYFEVITYTAKDAWSRPDMGYLGGSIIEVNGTKGFTLSDFHKKLWQIDSGELGINSINYIKIGAEIRIIGLRLGESEFEAKEVFPWDN